MAWIHNLSIGKRLGFLVSVAFLATVITVLVSMVNNSRLADRVDFSYQAITRPLAATANARGQFNALRTSLYDLAQDFNTSKDNDHFKRQIMENLEGYQSNIKIYKEILDTYGTNDPYEAKAVAYLYDQLEPLHISVDQIVSVAEEVGKGADAVLILRGDFLEAANDLSEVLSDLTMVLEEQNHMANQYARELKKTNDALLLIITTFSAVMLLAIAHSVVRSIIVPVNEAIDVLSDISKGDFNVRVKGDYKSDMVLLKDSVNDTAIKLSTYINDKLEAERTAYELEQLSMTDALTDLANRRRFDQQFGIEWARAIREKKEMSLLMLDADNFKKYNDRYGHPAGDSFLKTLAQTIHENMKRPADFAARLGGEEFSVLLPDTDLEGAVTVAENIRTAVERLNVPSGVDPRLPMTVSIGVKTVSPNQGCSMTELIEGCDQCLYKAKKEGRNRISFGIT